MCNIKEEMNAAKSSITVKQLEISQSISSPQYKYVVFIEGKDDMPCYRSWIGKIDQKCLKEMEFIILNDKDCVLSTFWDYMERGIQREGVSDKIYAMIDYDFDGYKTYKEHDRIYLNPDVYSIENIICSEEVLEEILRSKFLCNDNEHITKIKQAYKKELGSFINETKKVNEQIFFSKRLGKKIKINDISIKFNDSLVINNIQNILEYDGPFDIPHELRIELLAEFNKLNEEKQYRGKFLFEFFKQWIVFIGRNSGIPSVKICNYSYGEEYKGIILSKENQEHKLIIKEKKVTNNVNQWCLGYYCSFSSPPDSLEKFIHKITS